MRGLRRVHGHLGHHARSEVCFASVMTCLAKAPVGTLDRSTFHAAERTGRRNILTQRRLDPERVPQMHLINLPATTDNAANPAAARLRTNDALPPGPEGRGFHARSFR